MRALGRVLAIVASIYQKPWSLPREVPCIGLGGAENVYSLAICASAPARLGSMYVLGLQVYLSWGTLRKSL